MANPKRSIPSGRFEKNCLTDSYCSCFVGSILAEKKLFFSIWFAGKFSRNDQKKKKKLANSACWKEKRSNTTWPSGLLFLFSHVAHSTLKWTTRKMIYGKVVAKKSGFPTIPFESTEHKKCADIRFRTISLYFIPFAISISWIFMILWTLNTQHCLFRRIKRAMP